MLIICRLCGKPEQHEARGLGRNCYQQLQKRGDLQRFPDRKAAFRALYAHYKEGEHHYAELEN